MAEYAHDRAVYRHTHRNQRWRKMKGLPQLCSAGSGHCCFSTAHASTPSTCRIVLCTRLWRVGACCRCTGCVLSWGVAGVVLPAGVCCVSCFTSVYCYRQCACSVLIALCCGAGCPRLLSCPAACSAVCVVLHATSHLAVSNPPSTSPKKPALCQTM